MADPGFSRQERANPKGGGTSLLFGPLSRENCMKMKEGGPLPRSKFLDPPMIVVAQEIFTSNVIAVADPGFARLEVPTSKVGAPTYYFGDIFPENCMKMKEFEPRGGARPWAPLDPSKDLSARPTFGMTPHE